MGPAMQSLIPNLVPAKELTNAISLNSTVRQIATIAGPALAGVIIATAAIGWVYALNTLSFAAIILALALMHHRGRAAATDTGLNFKAVQEGWHFVRHTRIIWGTMLLDFFATFFSSARTMLPLVAGQMLGVGAAGYGLLSTAEAVGSLLAGVILSLRRDIYRQGAVLLGSVAIYGLATALFGLSTSFALSYVLFGLVGAADTVSTVIRQTIRQLMTPDHLRGRMTGINQIFFMGGPQLGELEAGVVAAIFGVPFAIVSGGIATIVMTGWIAWKYPRLRRYTSERGRDKDDGSSVKHHTSCAILPATIEHSDQSLWQGSQRRSAGGGGPQGSPGWAQMRSTAHTLTTLRWLRGE